MAWQCPYTPLVCCIYPICAHAEGKIFCLPGPDEHLHPESCGRLTLNSAEVIPNVRRCYHTEGVRCMGFQMGFQKGGGFPSVLLLYDRRFPGSPVSQPKETSQIRCRSIPVSTPLQGQVKLTPLHQDPPGWEGHLSSGVSMQVSPRSWCLQLHGGQWRSHPRGEHGPESCCSCPQAGVCLWVTPAAPCTPRALLIFPLVIRGARRLTQTHLWVQGRYLLS